MNRCFTKRLASCLSCRHLLTSAPQRSTNTPVSTHATWSSAHSRPLRHLNIFPINLRWLSTRLTSVDPRFRLRPPVGSGSVSGFSSSGRWRVSWPTLPPRRLSDRTTERCGLALAASWFTLLTVQSECDEVDFDLLLKNKILNPEEEQTGWDRLAAMYTMDEMGGLTPELELVRNIATAGLLIGGCLGAMLNGRLAIVKFVERNQATPFESPIVAKRALQDRVTLGMARGFFMFGWRTALFTSAFALVSTTLMVYTNQISTLHYGCGGVAAGALYKVNLGLRGMAAGAVAGGILGLIGGGVFSLACYLTDTTLPKLRYQQYLWKHQQELRAQARAERKREKKRLEAEKKLEEKKEELAQSQVQEAVVAAMRNADTSQEPTTEHYTDTGSPEEATDTQNSDSSEEAVRIGQGSSRSAVSAAGGRTPDRTETGFEAAVAVAAAAVAGTEVQSGVEGAVEAGKVS